MTNRPLLLPWYRVHQSKPDRHLALTVHTVADDLTGRVRVVASIQVTDPRFRLTSGAGAQNPRAVIDKEVERSRTALRTTRMGHPVFHPAAVPAEDVL